MTISCSGPDEGPIPRRSSLAVQCDRTEHDGFPPPVFAMITDVPTFYRDAVKAGWLMGAIAHLCPDCKQARARQ